MTKYEEYLARARRTHGEKFTDAQLAPHLVKYFNSGERVRVAMPGLIAEQLTGTIGVTTGWRPCFLLMRSTRARGSMWTLDKESKVLAVKRGRAYVDAR